MTPWTVAALVGLKSSSQHALSILRTDLGRGLHAKCEDPTIHRCGRLPLYKCQTPLVRLQACFHACIVNPHCPGICIFCNTLMERFRIITPQIRADVLCWSTVYKSLWVRQVMSVSVCATQL
eukprot:m.868477 g.868477  ORF g.868477 m.868477 type:complete len:122 (-) comp23563_c0_seq1:6-371(-)